MGAADQDPPAPVPRQRTNRRPAGTSTDGPPAEVNQNPEGIHNFS